MIVCCIDNRNSLNFLIDGDELRRLRELSKVRGVSCEQVLSECIPDQKILNKYKKEDRVIGYDLYVGNLLSQSTFDDPY